MKKQIIKLTLCIFCMSIFLSNAHATAPCNLNTSPGSTLESECIERMNKVQNLNLWDGDGKAISVNELKQRLNKLVNQMPIESDEKKPYIKQFIPEARRHITQLINERNKDWTDEYLAKIQLYNESRASSQNFSDELSQFSSSLENLLSQKKRQHSLTRIYLQNMAGIPTTYLIIGKSSWDINSKIAPLTIFEQITHHAAHYIVNELSASLIFSNTKIINSKISSDVIKSTKKVRVEEFETDPIYFPDGSTCYVIHKYRSYPLYHIPESDQSNKTSHKASLDSTKDIQYWNIDTATISKYQTDNTFPKSLIMQANKQLTDIETENSASIAQIQGFAQKYKESWDNISQKQKVIILKISEIKRLIQEKIGDMVSSEEFQTQLTDPLIELQHSDDVDKAEDLKESMISWLRKLSNQFQNQKQTVESDINNWLKHRNMIVFTSKSEIMGVGEIPNNVASRLLSSAITSLEKRKRQLISYKLSTVKNGRLVSHEAEDFYNDGLPIRYLISPPILTFLNKASGESQFYNVSMFMAWEVQYTEQTTKASANKSLPTKPSNIYVDQNQQVSWFFGNEECFSFQEAAQLLPKGFKLPKRSDMPTLRNFVNQPGMSQLRNQYNYLFQSGTELWTGEQSSVTDKVYTYNITANEVFSHSGSSCCYVVGVGE